MTQMLPVALLAGGLATRMRPLTEKLPKSMLEVAGEPFIAHQLREFARQGISRVVVCTGFLGEMIEAYVGDGTRFGLSVVYSPDGEVLRGTGGALRQAIPLLGEEFMVIYGDSWLKADFAAITQSFREQGKLALMTVFRNEGAFDTSNVEFADGVIHNYDKKNGTPQMHHIDWGLGLVCRDAFRGWDQEHFDLADLYRGLVPMGELAGYEVYERFYEVGSFAGLKETDGLLQVGLK